MGSGLAGVTAAKFLLDAGIRVTLVSSSYKDSPKKLKKKSYSTRLPEEQLANTEDLIVRSSIEQENFNLIGSADLGGLSKFWGGGYVFDYNYINKYQIQINHKELNGFVDLNYAEEKKSGLIEYLEKFSSDGFNIFKPKYVKSSKVNEFFSALEILDELQTDKNFTFVQDFFVSDIDLLETGKFRLKSESKKNPYLDTEKVVLAAGTISTTKLLCSFFEIKNKKIKMLHNPSLAIGFFLKQNISTEQMKIIGQAMFLQTKKKSKKVVAAGLIGLIDEQIIDIFLKTLPFLGSFFLKYLLTFFKARIAVANCFLPNEYTKTYITWDGRTLKIKGGYSDRFYKEEKKIRSKLLKSFKRFSNLVYFYKMSLGADIHYTGTVNKDNHKLFELNKDFSLVSNKNIYVIDGSIIKGNPIYPGIYIINNAISFAKNFRKKIISPR